MSSAPHGVHKSWVNASWCGVHAAEVEVVAAASFVTVLVAVAVFDFLLDKCSVSDSSLKPHRNSLMSLIIIIFIFIIKNSLHSLAGPFTPGSYSVSESMADPEAAALKALFLAFAAMWFCTIASNPPFHTFKAIWLPAQSNQYIVACFNKYG